MPRPADDVTRTVERTRSQRPLGAVVRVLNVPANPPELVLREGTCRLGSGTGADMVISEATVSRAHAEVELAPEGVVVTDLGSRNGCTYLGKPFQRRTLALGSRFRLGSAELELAVDRASLEAPPPEDLTSYGDLVGASPAMRRLFGQLARLEPSLVTVLVQGEPGTGKKLVARALHDHSLVASGPFVAVDCRTLDRTIAASELFGHRKGALPGAVVAQAGAFEAASGGTLFLDDVGGLSLEAQPLLLRALEASAITRVGESAERPVQARVIAASHEDLSREVDAGRFHRDLYFRLTVVKLTIPPLRERPDAIEALARHLARGLGVQDLPDTMVDELRHRPFPGNVRELRNVLEAYAVLGPPAESGTWGARELPTMLRRSIDVGAPYAAQKEALLRIFESVFVEALLAHTSGDRARAAVLSGLEERSVEELARRVRR